MEQTPFERFDGFQKTGLDADVEALLTRHCEKFGLSHLEAIKLYTVLARRQWFKRLLAHIELFKLTLEIPGDIAELGVFRGLGLFTWANLLESYCIGDRTKTVYGFDNWLGFTDFSPQDGDRDENLNKVTGGFSPADFKTELLEAIDIFDKDRFIPWKKRLELIDGDIGETVPDFVGRNPGVRFSLIHFDCDLYRPTKIALECLWPRLSRGGLMLFDEYAIRGWPGETAAVDEYFADKPEVKILTLPWTNAPAGYIIKS